MFYYRGLQEWDREKGYPTDTCLSAHTLLSLVNGDFALDVILCGVQQIIRGF